MVLKIIFFSEERVMNKYNELEFLMNPVLYDKYQKSSSKERTKTFSQEKKFYRKRIQDMAKGCAKFGIVKDIPKPNSNLLQAFDYFAATCIEHFKLIDEAECYQHEYSDLDLCKSKSGNTSPQSIARTTALEGLDKSLFRSNGKKKVVLMDNFVKKTNVKHRKMPCFPTEKVANVKDQKFRTKGIKKNKSNDIINNESGDLQPT